MEKLSSVYMYKPRSFCLILAQCVIDFWPKKWNTFWAIYKTVYFCLNLCLVFAVSLSRLRTIPSWYQFKSQWWCHSCIALQLFAKVWANVLMDRIHQVDNPIRYPKDSSLMHFLLSLIDSYEFLMDSYGFLMDVFLVYTIHNRHKNTRVI